MELLVYWRDASGEPWHRCGDAVAVDDAARRVQSLARRGKRVLVVRASVVASLLDDARALPADFADVDATLPTPLA
jgi:hypothetical protein